MDKERNYTRQVELAGGWGTAHNKLRAELLGGAAYGRARFAQCTRSPVFESDTDCDTWVHGKARFARAFVQAQVGAKLAWMTSGGGLRVSLVHLKYSELFGQQDGRTARIPVVEPFLVQRFDLPPYGSIEVMLHVPLVPYSRDALAPANPDAFGAEPRPTRLAATPRRAFTWVISCRSTRSGAECAAGPPRHAARVSGVARCRRAGHSRWRARRPFSLWRASRCGSAAA